MARGKHRKRSGLLARLWPGRAADRSASVPRRRGWNEQDRAILALQADSARLGGEVARLRALGAQHAAAAASADLRARRAEEQLGAVLGELSTLRVELAGLREELVWAFAARKIGVDAPAEAPAEPAASVIDLRSA